MKIRRRVFGAFELAESATDPAERGPLAHLRPGRRRADRGGAGRADPRGRHQDAAPRVPAHQARGRPGPAVRRRRPPRWPSFGPKLSALAARDLGKLGVELHMGSIVTDVDLGGLEVKDHDGNVTRYEVGTILWTAGVAAPPLAAGGGQGHRRGAGPGGPLIVRQGPVPARPSRRSWSPGT